jgi:hypothetical protein
MFKTKYTRISYFDFYVISSLLTDHLGYTNTKELDEEPFMLSHEFSDVGFKIKKQFEQFKYSIVNPNNSITNLISYGFLEKEKLDDFNKQALIETGRFKKRSKFKYIFTTKCLNFIDRFNNIETRSLFPLYNITPKQINILCVLITSEQLNIEQNIVNELNKNLYINTVTNCSNDLILLKNLNLVSRKKEFDNECFEYKITTLGKNVLNLILDIDSFLIKQEEEEHSQLPIIETEFKTRLVCPLWFQKPKTTKMKENRI